MYPTKPGDRFNRLLVIELGPRTKSFVRRWVCKCDCGDSTLADERSLHKGRSKSCGCWRHEMQNAMRKRRASKSIRLGQDGHVTSTYRIWKGMRERCRNPNIPNYFRYGGRGITVCERWQTYANFLADMGECPPGLSIERENNDGNYEPGNCHWATDLEQGRNTRKVRLTAESRAYIDRRIAEGARHHIVAAELGVNRSTVSDYKRGKTWVGA